MLHAVLGQTGVECAHGVTVRVGMAEKDFERVFQFGYEKSIILRMMY